ncbi:hypothetical protein HAX54_015941 [Datura stramonium]|uniref:RNase H type-1 domain-containing protein n=1 Tax=Datura stramonium TaxID=4076 RepID=A0ABS8UI88_DATST|nr:hypothetical protein [Datura stramonium]
MCCRIPRHETLDHLFTSSDQAIKVVMAEFSRLEPNWGWITVCQLAEAYKPRINSSMIRWTKTNRDIWKLNTDGSFKERHKVAGIGGIVRKEMEIWSLLSQDLSNSRLTMPAS